MKRRTRNNKSQVPESREIPTKVVRAIDRSIVNYHNQGGTLARQMAIPDMPQSHVIRMPTVDMPAVAAIAVQDSFNTVTAELSTSAGKLPVSTSGTLMFISYGQPGRALVYGPIATTLAADTITNKFEYRDRDNYTIVANTQALLYGGGSPPTYPKGTTISGFWNPVNVVSSNISDEPTRPLGFAKERTYIYVNGTEKLSWEGWYGPGSTAWPVSLVIRVYRWHSPSDPPTLASTLGYANGDTAVTSFSWTPTESGYYTWDYSVGVLDSASFSGDLGLTFTIKTAIANPRVMVHRFNAALQKKDVGDYMRRTGFAVLISNTSAEINKQGTVVAARMLAEGPSSSVLAGSQQESSVAALANKYTGMASKGLYTYMDFDMYAERFNQAFNESSCPVFDLDYNGFAHIALISNPSAATQANSFLVTFYGIYEFFSDDPLYPSVPAHFDHNALCEARRVNNSTAYFYENPLHMSDIWKFIRNSFNVMRRAAIPIGMATSAMFPEAAPFAMPIAHALQT